jgi:hypothetical protein
VKNSFTPPQQEKQEKIEQLRKIQQQMESKTVTETLMNQEKEAQQHLQHTLRREEEHWRLKSRSLWIKEGDSNTSFFHKQAQSRRKKNTVTSITSSTGQQIDSFEQVKAEAYRHFNNLYQQPIEEATNTEAIGMLANIPEIVSEPENNQLVQEISEEEIAKAIWSLDPDKAPGPDGFPIRFYRSYWDIIKRDLKKMLNYTLHKQKVGGATNSTFLALIPKESNPSNFSRFHPISLCNSSYKILTKIIATRLSPLLTKLISENQSGFLKDKQITDNIVLVQEAIHSSKKTKTPGMVVKLDMENTFDRVKHSFLFSILKAYGFSENFINWIKACISMPWVSPLLNGRPSNFFKASRGLRQGCPLSPFLYILLADSLSRKLEEERRKGNLPGLLIARGVKEINHSQFADDTLLLGSTTIRTAKRFQNILSSFLAASGGKLNISKCRIYGWHVPGHIKEQIARIFGFPIITTWNYFKYLGMPIFLSSYGSSAWLEIIGKISARIQNWGGRWLNPAGKIVLIKSVLSSLSIFQCSGLLAPKGILEKISRALRMLSLGWW